MPAGQTGKPAARQPDSGKKATGGRVSRNGVGQGHRQEGQRPKALQYFASPKNNIVAITQVTSNTAMPPSAISPGSLRVFTGELVPRPQLHPGRFFKFALSGLNHSAATATASAGQIARCAHNRFLDQPKETTFRFGGTHQIGVSSGCRIPSSS